MKLSKPQQIALDRMEPGVWHCAYDLRVGINTLDALVRHGLIEYRTDLDYLFCPQTGRKYRLKQAPTAREDEANG